MISNAIAVIETRAAGLSCPVFFAGAPVEKPDPPVTFAVVEVDPGVAGIAATGNGALLRYGGELSVALYAPFDQRAALLSACDEVVTLFPTGLRLDHGVMVWKPTMGRVELADGDVGWLTIEINIEIMVDQ